MQGQQDSQRVLFDTIELERLVPDDHLLRRIDARIDFDFIYEVTKGLYCADNGRNSVDPVLFFRMQLISYLYGMKSDHASMTRIRDRFGEATFTDENGGDKLVHGSGGISQPRAE